MLVSKDKVVAAIKEYQAPCRWQVRLKASLLRTDHGA
jgi:hypothetical protein